MISLKLRFEEVFELLNFNLQVIEIHQRIQETKKIRLIEVRSLKYLTYKGNISTEGYEKLKDKNWIYQGILSLELSRFNCINKNIHEVGVCGW